LSNEAANAAVIKAAHENAAGNAKVSARATTALAVDALDTSAAPTVRGHEDLGDCIDCTICVQVCPVGIDIRNGLQSECIACGACIDACDEVMDKMGYPHGLVRYTTQNAVDHKDTRVLRPRIIVYGLLLTAIFIGWMWGVMHRQEFIVDVLRDRNALYRTLDDGDIENSYTVKLINKLPKAARYSITLVEGEGISLVEAPLEVSTNPEEVVNLSITLHAEAGTIKGRRDVVLRVQSLEADGTARDHKTSFFSPM
jgi:cytochrome c oxidase accessory protein FixG